MNKSNYASDSESDEDYFIDGDNGDPHSSDETENSASEDPEESNNKHSNKRWDNIVPKNDSIENVEISAARQTRQSVVSKNSLRFSEKVELESDEEADKTRSDRLWANFLSDVGSEGLTKSKSNPNEATGKTDICFKPDTLELPNTSTEIASIGFEKLLDVTKQNTTAQQSNVSLTPDIRLNAPKRPPKSSSASSVINQLKKKQKMSVLEKSQVDWKNFKTDEGIDEELRTHNKGKDGYLERQDFLQRTDLRQFEIEKNLRQSRRQN